MSLSPPPPPGEPHPPAGRALARLRRLAYLLDDSIPLPGVGRIGLDPLIGLVPGVGDAAGTLLSAYLVLEAARLGAPRPILLRMLLNVAVEAVLGVVPALGDLFDAGWKANARNVRLLTEYLERPHPAERASRGFLLFLMLALLLLLVGSAVLMLLVLRALIGLL